MKRMGKRMVLVHFLTIKTGPWHMDVVLRNGHKVVVRHHDVKPILTSI